MSKKTATPCPTPSWHPASEHHSSIFFFRLLFFFLLALFCSSERDKTIQSHRHTIKSNKHLPYRTYIIFLSSPKSCFFALSIVFTTKGFFIPVTTFKTNARVLTYTCHVAKQDKKKRRKEETMASIARTTNQVNGNTII